MGYTTTFIGKINVQPPLNADEIDYLIKFSDTRRMLCKQGPYYADRGDQFGQARGPDVIDYNKPPEGQPSLWCNWVPTDGGHTIEWNGTEKFYNSPEWMQYLIDHFIGIAPIAKPMMPFLDGHILNGEIEAQGEDIDDRWKLIVENNIVKIAEAAIIYILEEKT